MDSIIDATACQTIQVARKDAGHARAGEKRLVMLCLTHMRLAVPGVTGGRGPLRPGSASG